MKTYKGLTVAALAVYGTMVHGQDWHQNFPLGNTVSSPLEFLGCDASSTEPLRLKTLPNYAIDLYTNDMRRFTLLPDATYTVGSFAGQVKDGCLLHSPNVDQFYANGGPGPFSVDHVAAADDNAEQQYYRPWMHVGTTYTGNKDQGYVGQKAGAEGGKTDMVLHFGGLTDGSQVNHLRAIYTTGYSGANTGARSMEGLEFLRLWPRDNDQPHVGIGDWYAASVTSGGLINEPEERLDVVNGNVRIRDLPTQPQSSSTDVVVVATNGNLERRPASSLLTGDCDWQLSPATNRMLTAWQPAVDDDLCPEEDWLIGIGTPSVSYKLDVLGKRSIGGAAGAVRGDFRGANIANTQIGVAGTVSPEGTVVPNPVGVSGTISNVGATGYAVQGTANVNASGVTSTGTSAVFGRVNASAGTTGFLYGTRGEVANSGTDMSANGSTAYGSFGSVSGAAAMNTTIGMYGVSTVTGTQTSSFGGYAVSTRNTGASVANSTGLYAASSGAPAVTNSYGVNASATGGTTNTIGVNCVAFGSTGTTNTYGVYGQGLGSTTNSIGVFGRSANSGTGAGITRIGVYGNTNFAVADLLATNISVYGDNAGGGNNQWAGFFPGRTFSPTGFWTASDEELKTDISEIEQSDSDPVDKLLSLNPRSYQFNVAGFPQIGLPVGQQYGFLAQELEEQFPEMVADIVHPARYDSTGAELTAALPFKAVNTSGLLPLAIEALKRQEARIGQLEEMVAACCDARAGTRAVTNSTGAGASLETDLRIIPNPVADQTELRYTVGTAGRVRLEITDASGRAIQLQEEGMRSTGTFSFGWDTTLLAPGTYFCTLYVNDEPLVKKAVKLSAR